jgi:hypothetical protein
MTTAMSVFCAIPPSVWLDPYALHSHWWNETPISRRSSNGYVNATAARLLPGHPVADENTVRRSRAQLAGG